MGSYAIGIVGESKRNRDGSSRQAEIRRCDEGEDVQLVREPDNPHDALAVRVDSLRGVTIGYIPREAEWIAERIDGGRPVRAWILSIRDGEDAPSGVWLNVDTDPPAAPAAAPKEWKDLSTKEKAAGMGCLAAIVLALIGLAEMIF